MATDNQEDETMSIDKGSRQGSRTGGGKRAGKRAGTSDEQGLSGPAGAAGAGPQYPTVRKLIEFQKTGKGFDSFWADVHDIVVDSARKSLLKALQKRGVNSAYGDMEEANGDVVGETCRTHKGLSKPEAGGRFAPAKCRQPGMSGLKGWLYRIVSNEAVTWVRKHRGGRGLKITSETAIGWNDLSGDDESSTFLERQVAKIERPDLLPILQECIAELDDPLMRALVTLKLDQDLSVRKSAERLDLADSMVQRRLTTAYALLRPLLEARGVDATWLAA